MDKQTKQINSLGKSLVCGGLALVGGMAYLYMNKLKSSKTRKITYSRETIIKVLKDFQKEFYSVNRDIRITISLYLNRMQQMQRGQRIPQQYISDLKQMVEKDPRIVSMLEKAEDNVYERNEIFDRKSFEDQVKLMSLKDQEIKNISQQIKGSYDKAFNGQYEILNIEYPSIIDEELVFNIKRDITKMELKEMLHFLQRLQEINKSSNLQDLETRQALDKHVQDKLQQFVYPETFEFTNDHYPATIHSQAMIQFADKNRKFEEKLIELQEFKGKFINALHEQTDFSILEQELESIDTIKIIEEPLIKEIEIQQEQVQENVIEVEVKENEELPIEIQENLKNQDEAINVEIEKNN